jgi:hypothetical protein
MQPAMRTCDACGINRSQQATFCEMRTVGKPFRRELPGQFYFEIAQLYLYFTCII